MAILKCKMCGGELEIGGSATIATCEYCGTKQTLPKTTDSATQNLFNRANDLRIKCEFDRAEQTYEKILELDNSDAEAHWGLLLCRYGIEYVDDPGTGKKIPTCHRASFDPILTDSDYLAAVEMSDGEQKELYLQEAKQISEIQKGILQIAQSEEPFDVFLCYKETGENGKRTTDSVIANDIYYQLTEEGYKVFYAPITLEDKLGSAYEPHIFAALNSAKVMLVIGTKPAHFDAVWVKNEWSRFLALMKKDRSKLLIPCYKDMDPYDLPDRFAHLQAQDMGKIGFINDVVRGIKKVIPKEAAPVPQPVYAPPVYTPQPAYTPAPPVTNVKPEPEPLVIPEGHVAIFDSVTMSLVQRIVMLISVIAASAAFLLVQLAFYDSINTSFISQIITYVFHFGLPACTLGLGITCFVRKKKDIVFWFLCLCMVLITTVPESFWDTAIRFRISKALPFILYLLLLLIPAFLMTIPALAHKVRWLRFLYWIAPAIMIGFLTDAQARYMYGALILPFMYATTVHGKRKKAYVISEEKLKKRNRNTIIAFAASVVLAVAVLPSAIFELYGNLEGDLSYYRVSIFTSTEKYNEMRYMCAFDTRYRYTDRVDMLEDLVADGYREAEYDLLYFKYDYVVMPEGEHLYGGETVERTTKLQYLEDLAAVNYKDSKALLEEELKWRVELVYYNTNLEDYETSLNTIPLYTNYLHIGATLKGGRPGERINVTHTTKWPGKTASAADWDWEDKGENDWLIFQYNNGYSCNSVGYLEIEYYNKDTGELIGTISIPVQ